MYYTTLEQELKHIGTGTIWSFWDGNPPELVLRCVESMKINNPSRPLVVVSKATLPQFLGPEDYPIFNGTRGTPDDFSCAQYLSDWVRLTLLEKYGGVWFDASVICTNSVESWVDSDDSKITMFPMHANKNIHGNWAMAAMKPGHPLIRAWRHELSAVYNETGPGKVPLAYIDRVFQEHQPLVQLWNNCPTPPPLPYLWVYLSLQVVLQKQGKLHSTVTLLPCIDGPMYRRYLYNIQNGVTDSSALSQATADDLATKPLDLETHDRWFIKLVGSDRCPVQDHLEAGSYQVGSALEVLSFIQPRSIMYGVDLQSLLFNADATARFRVLAHAVLAATNMQRLASSKQYAHEQIVLSLREETAAMSRRRSSAALAA